MPDTGLLRRDLYPKHLKFMNGSSVCRELVFIAGNRTGKTMSGAAKTVYLTTGQYPSWYQGKRFNKPVNGWVVGKDSKTVRDILQYELLGNQGQFGTGMLPKDCIVDYSSKPGTPGAVEMIFVKNKFGGTSKITFKSYDQGFDSFVGTHMDFIWFDEEVPEDIYNECLVRTMRTDAYDPSTEGIIYLTFTPDHGITPLVEHFMMEGTGKLAEGIKDGRMLVNVTWDDVPHLSKEEKERMMTKLPPHMREAKIRGIPTVGSGAIYPVPDSSIVIEPFKLPDYFERGYSMDTSYNGRATLWFAIDPSTGVMYIYKEFIASQVPISTHVVAVRGDQHGSWLRGVIDPAAERNINDYDSKSTFELLTDLGLDLELADNSFETGLERVRLAMESGTLKIFETCRNLIKEKHFYRRDEKGNIVQKGKYHLMDCLRYAVMSGRDVAQAEVDAYFKDHVNPTASRKRDDLTGY